MSAKKVFTLGFFALIWCCLGVAANMQGLRGQRYCEVLLGVGVIPNTIQVFNTMGLNQCPEDLWEKITTEQIKKETGARFVRLNGPRYWVIDGFQNTFLIDKTIKTFGGIAMRKAGILKLKIRDLVLAEKPYRMYRVKRMTTWIFNVGQPVYEIKDNLNRVFIMQSYSIQKVMQTQASLAELGSKLHLPNGWHFQTRILSQQYLLTPRNKTAIVITDEFLNTYQLETNSH